MTVEFDGVNTYTRCMNPAQGFNEVVIGIAVISIVGMLLSIWKYRRLKKNFKQSKDNFATYLKDLDEWNKRLKAKNAKLEEDARELVKQT